MPTYRIPGPICATQDWMSIDDGTLARWLMPPVTSVCATSPLFGSEETTDTTDAEEDVSFLFRQCLNPKRGLTDADYERAARSLDVEVASIKAVAEVESPRGPFDPMGRPEILFERHYFSRLTDGEYDDSNPDISNPNAGGYGKYSAQYGKLERAYKLDSNAALRSASWGRFQIMGDNYAAAGFSSVGAFVRAMTKSEVEHLNAFVNFIKSDAGRLSALRKKDWAQFARRYNGPAYKKNSYDTKLQAAYEKYAEPAQGSATQTLP